MSQVTTLNAAWTDVDPEERRLRLTFALRVVYALWFLLLFEPEWFLASFGLTPLTRIPTLLFPITIVMALFYAPRATWYWPMALFLLSHAWSIPFVMVRGIATKQTKFVLYFYVLMLITVALVDTARKLRPILLMLLVQFGWYGIQGIPEGLVHWHSILDNEDSYGPLMVIGLGYSYYFAMATGNKRLKLVGRLIAGLCLVGIVASFARGAVLAAGLVAVLLWIRSPRKVVTFFGGIVAVGVFVAATMILFPSGEFWSEMETVNEGVEAGTSADRWALWQVGIKTFFKSNCVGVGTEQCGVWASENFTIGEAGGVYANPGRLWGRSLHNVYVQLLCEQGLLGTSAFLFVIWDFFRRNRGLRRRASLLAWSRMGRGLPDLKPLSLAFELAMVGYLSSAVFYGQLYPHWWYTLVTLNLTLSTIVSRAVRNAGAEAPAGPRAV